MQYKKKIIKQIVNFQTDLNGKSINIKSNVVYADDPRCLLPGERLQVWYFILFFSFFSTFIIYWLQMKQYARIGRFLHRGFITVNHQFLEINKTSLRSTNVYAGTCMYKKVWKMKWWFFIYFSFFSFYLFTSLNFCTLRGEWFLIKERENEMK